MRENERGKVLLVPLPSGSLGAGTWKFHRQPETKSYNYEVPGSDGMAHCCASLQHLIPVSTQDDNLSSRAHRLTPH